MSKIEVRLTKMAESVAEATIIKWLKNEGDSVESDESIIEIATDKVDSEVPAPVDGILAKKMCNDGDVVQVGEVIAILTSDSAEEVIKANNGVQETVEIEKSITIEVSKTEPFLSEATSNKSVGTAPVVEQIAKKDSTGRFFSPLVRSIAKTEGISINELSKVSGTGKDGRVTKQNLLEYLKLRDNPNNVIPDISASSTTTIPTPNSLNNSATGEDEIIEMDRMRKLISEHMVRSKTISPHVTSYVEADVTNIVTWRNHIKNTFLEQEGEKLTFTPIFIEAIVKALKDFPMVNVSIDGNNIIRHKNINIGMATALPSGNLIVPVIKNADRLSLKGLSKAVNDLANRARNNKLLPEEIQGGTYTITNVGTFGNVMGTPIINQPQAAIMAVGAIRKKPAVIETDFGDTIGIRQMMFLSHAYDHRIIDGALGGSFVRKVADYLEAFDKHRKI